MHVNYMLELDNFLVIGRRPRLCLHAATLHALSLRFSVLGDYRPLRARDRLNNM